MTMDVLSEDLPGDGGGHLEELNSRELGCVVEPILHSESSDNPETFSES